MKIQDEIGHWQKLAFPTEQTVAKRNEKVSSEIREFQRAMEHIYDLHDTTTDSPSRDEWSWNGEAYDLYDEMADVFITMYALAEIFHMDLDDRVRWKFTEAKKKYPIREEMPLESEIKPVRATPDQIWMEVAKSVSQRATCPRLAVGAVLIDRDGLIVSTGYNGAPRGLAHCSEVGCLLEPETGRCKRTVHAEQNAIIQADKIRMNFGTLYVTHEPCIECSQMILNSGVSRVVYEKPYNQIFSEVENMFRESGIQIGRIDRGA